MTKPKPIKRSPALVQFSKDHHFALLLIWKVRQGLSFGVGSDRIANYIDYFFSNYLEEHFKEEEDLLFIHLNKTNSLRTTAEQNHESLRKLAKDISKNAHDPSLITEFVDKLEKHIRLEERELFNELQNSIEEQQLNNIAKEMNKNHVTKIEENWQDEFWVKINNISQADKKHL